MIFDDTTESGCSGRLLANAFAFAEKDGSAQKGTSRTQQQMARPSSLSCAVDLPHGGVKDVAPDNVPGLGSAARARGH